MSPPTLVRRPARVSSRRATRTRRMQRVTRHPATWLAIVCSLPILIAAVREITGGWLPEGDDARVATRIRGVFTGHPPLLGMRSTSGHLNRQLDTHHPGPLEFYLDAPVSALFNYSAAGIVLAVMIVNLACVVGTVLMAHRMRGPRTAIPVAAALLLTEWLLGPDALTHPLNPYAGILSVFLMLVAAWSVLDRDPHGPWVMLLAGSFAAQANLAFGPVVLTACAVPLAVCGGRVWQNFRRGHAGRSWRSRAAARKRALITAAIVGLAWLPPAIELFVLHPNNLQLLARFVTSDHPAGEKLLGLPAGAAFVVGHLWPTALGRLDPDVSTSPSDTTVGIGLAVLVIVLVAATAGPRLPRTAATRGCWVILAAVVGECIALSHMQQDTQRSYWKLPVLVITPLAYSMLVIRVVELLRTTTLPDRLSNALQRVHPRRVLGTALVVGLAAALLASMTARPPALANSERSRAVADTVLDYIHLHGRPGTPVEIDAAGLRAWITVSPAVGYQLLRAGHPAHFMLDWSYPEDTTAWNVSTAPAGSIVVTLADDSSAPNVKLHTGAVPLPLPVVASGTRAWIAIPAGDRR